MSVCVLSVRPTFLSVTALVKLKAPITESGNEVHAVDCCNHPDKKRSTFLNSLPASIHYNWPIRARNGADMEDLWAI